MEDLIATNGVALGVGDNLSGSGTINAQVAATFGSTITASGLLTVGNANAYDGFASDGVLNTNAHEVIVNDQNEAVLGSLTTLGDGSSGGTLTAGNADPSDDYSHFLVEQGKNVTGRGMVNGHFKNHGHVIGDGTPEDERLVFNADWTVTGKGTFTNTLIWGTFSPGDSPAITNGENQGFGGTVEIELGGTEPGSGNDNHDRINDSATISLFSEPELSILPWNSFVPEVGDEFLVMTWQHGLSGTFGTVTTDPWFTDHGISFELNHNNAGGTGGLTLVAIPEPSTIILLAMAGVGLLVYRLRKK